MPSLERSFPFLPDGPQLPLASPKLPVSEPVPRDDRPGPSFLQSLQQQRQRRDESQRPSRESTAASTASERRDRGTSDNERAAVANERATAKAGPAQEPVKSTQSTETPVSSAQDETHDSGGEPVAGEAVPVQPGELPHIPQPESLVAVLHTTVVAVEPVLIDQPVNSLPAPHFEQVSTGIPVPESFPEAFSSFDTAPNRTAAAAPQAEISRVDVGQPQAPEGLLRSLYGEQKQAAPANPVEVFIPVEGLEADAVTLAIPSDVVVDETAAPAAADTLLGATTTDAAGSVLELETVTLAAPDGAQTPALKPVDVAAGDISSRQAEEKIIDANETQPSLPPAEGLAQEPAPEIGKPARTPQQASPALPPLPTVEVADAETPAPGPGPEPQALAAADDLVPQAVEPANDPRLQPERKPLEGKRAPRQGEPVPNVAVGEVEVSPPSDDLMPAVCYAETPGVEKRTNEGEEPSQKRPEVYPAIYAAGDSLANAVGNRGPGAHSTIGALGVEDPRLQVEAAAPSDVAVDPALPRAEPRSTSPAATKELSAADAQQLVDRVARAVRHSVERNSRLQIRLHPPELGILTVEVASRDGNIVARLEVQSAAAQQRVMEQLPQLKDALHHAGTHVERIEVQVVERGNEGSRSNAEQRGNQDGSGQSEQRGQGQQQQQRSPGRDPHTGRDASSDAADESDAALPDVSQARAGGMDQLNIKV